MSIKPYDELPWWCQLLRPWFGPPWYERVEDRDAYLAAYWCVLHLSAAELAALLAGDDPPGEGYLAKARRLIAARLQARRSSATSMRRPYQRVKTSATNTTGLSQT
jgi:hypothetical protein